METRIKWKVNVSGLDLFRDLKTQLDRIAEASNASTNWPSDKLVNFFNFLGKIKPFGTLGMILLSGGFRSVLYWAGIKKDTDKGLAFFRDFQPDWKHSPVFTFLNQAKNCESIRRRYWFFAAIYRFLLNVTYNVVHTPYVASLGCGSGLHFIEAIEDSAFTGEVHLVDRNPDAIQRAQKILSEMGLNAQVHLGDIADFLSTLSHKLHLVDLVGVIYYIADMKIVVEMLSQIYESLEEGGLLVGDHICDDSESTFAHGAAHWPLMYYRSEDTIIDMLSTAGFKKIWWARVGIYFVYVAQK